MDFAFSSSYFSNFGMKTSFTSLQVKVYERRRKYFQQPSPGKEKQRQLLSVLHRRENDVRFCIAEQDLSASLALFKIIILAARWNLDVQVVFCRVASRPIPTSVGESRKCDLNGVTYGLTLV